MSKANSPSAPQEAVSPIWKPVPGHEDNYEVSDQGNVRSRPRPTTRGGLLRANVGKAGYLKVSLSSNGRQESRLVHHLVAAVFLGPRPDGLEIRHLDGDPLNCQLSNLAYGTRSENTKDRRRHGGDHNVNKTQCPHGHPYDETNTYFYNGRRGCRTCNRRRELRASRQAAVS